MIKVSIAIPIYGVESYIERCAVSLMEQTYSNIEYVFVNDCTKDNSINVLSACIRKYPSRINQIKIINHTVNKGLAGARNTAIENSSGDFILHVDADDYIDKNLVEELVAKQEETCSDIVVCCCKKVLNNKILSWPIENYNDITDYNRNVLELNIHHNIWGKLIRKSLYSENNIRNVEGINNTEDLQILPMLLYYAKSFATTNKANYYYDCSNDNSYTNVPKVSSSMQAWKTFDILMDFFENKGDDYINSIKIGKVKNLSMQMTRWAKYANQKDYYNSLVERLGEIDKLYYQYVSLVYRPVFILKNQRLVSVYVRIMHRLKELRLKMSN